MNGANNNGVVMKRAAVMERGTLISGRSCQQFFIFDVGIDGNGGVAQVASGTLIGGHTGHGSHSTGFLRRFSDADAWANAHNRVLVSDDESKSLVRGW